ncbi:MAG TPA: hypothetical protein VG326_03335 [Tepidisphaeraceae bacterium]|nr:hypothetical protein [Tepidisphaeraceae bacterium]
MVELIVPAQPFARREFQHRVDQREIDVPRVVGGKAGKSPGFKGAIWATPFSCGSSMQLKLLLVEQVRDKAKA